MSIKSAPLRSKVFVWASNPPSVSVHQPSPVQLLQH